MEHRDTDVDLASLPAVEPTEAHRRQLVEIVTDRFPDEEFALLHLGRDDDGPWVCHAVVAGQDYVLRHVGTLGQLAQRLLLLLEGHLATVAACSACGRAKPVHHWRRDGPCACAVPPRILA